MAARGQQGGALVGSGEAGGQHEATAQKRPVAQRVLRGIQRRIRRRQKLVHAAAGAQTAPDQNSTMSPFGSGKRLPPIQRDEMSKHAT